MHPELEIVIGCKLDYPNFTGVHPGRPQGWQGLFKNFIGVMITQNPIGVYLGAPRCTPVGAVTQSVNRE